MTGIRVASISMSVRIGFDVGGTFTDFVLFDGETGAQHVYKHPTTVEDPAEGVLQGLETLLENSAATTHDVEQLVHATTLATNTVLERDGADTALLVTEGFRDVPILGRQKRYDLYDLFIEKPDPIIPREHIYEVPERIHPREGVETPLDQDELAELAGDLEEKYEAVAVSFLHAYRDERHEREAIEILDTEAPSLYTTRASRVSKQYREYERTNTAAVDAYVKPRVDQYLGRIQDALTEREYDGSFFMMKSSGGVATPDMIRDSPVGIIESGPVAGALHAAHLGETIGHDDVFSFDMGGTTAKICFVVDGRPERTDVFEVDEAEMKEGSGLPINLTVVDMIEISAGGGSIAGAEDTGRITVGPESAGAEPGPICYDRGGTRPTVTDADLVLGYLNPEYFLGGRMDIDAEAAASGIERAIAEPLGLDVETAAWGVKEIVDNAMTRASRIHASERGLDPRRFAMIAFGGAGPVHAAFLARELNVPRVVVPPDAGVASASGLLVADVEFHLDQTRIMTLDEEAIEPLTEIYAALEEEGAELVAEAGHDPATAEVRREADMKYAGQAHDIAVELPDAEFDSASIADIKQRFHDTYERTYGYSDPDEPVEGITWKARIRAGTGGAAPTAGATEGSHRASDARKGHRPAYFGSADGFVETAVYDRGNLGPSASFSGPAVVESVNSTTVVPPATSVTVDERGNLVLDVEEDNA